MWRVLTFKVGSLATVPRHVLVRVAASLPQSAPPSHCLSTARLYVVKMSFSRDRVELALGDREGAYELDTDE